MLVGSGVPSKKLGSNGYSYINTDNWDYYLKKDGVWTFVSNLNNTSHNHSFTSKLTNPTCLTAGSVVLTCKECGRVETSSIEASGHNYGAWVELVKATCDSVGTKKRECLACGVVEEAEIPVHEHEYSDTYVFDTSTHWKYCTLCGIAGSEESHDSSSSTCSVCGYEIPANYPVDGTNSGLIFTLADDEESYILLDATTYEGTELIIPSTYKGKPVSGFVAGFADSTQFTSIVIPDTITELPKDGFKGFNNLTSVVIPDTITAIPEDFFQDCSSLSSIVLPNGLTKIGTNAFQSCKCLTSIVIPNGVEGISWGAFQYCSSLTSIILPSSVKYISGYAFFSCIKLTSVVFSNGLTSIGDYAFGNCVSLTDIIIPNGVTDIGNFVFEYCSSLTNVTIPSSVVVIRTEAFECYNLSSVIFENPKGWYADGKIYQEQLESPSIAAKLLKNTKCNTVWYRPSVVYKLNEDGESYSASMLYGSYLYEKSMVIDSTYNNLPVTKIADKAFSGCSTLENISIPNSVTSIGEYAFENCTGLTSITIPDSVTSIDSCAFYYCSGLTNITYNGTKEQWNSITKVTSWNYNTGAYTIHCTDGDISKE